MRLTNGWRRARHISVAVFFAVFAARTTVPGHGFDDRGQGRDDNQWERDGGDDDEEWDHRGGDHHGDGERAIYVKADAKPGGNGTVKRPFKTLMEVEDHSDPGDTVFVIPSTGVLDHGIQLKNRQSLIGLGPAVTSAIPHPEEPLLTNTSNVRYNGDVIRLAKHNTVSNLHIDNAFRSSILGINAVGARILGNVMSNGMAVHTIFEIEGPAPSKCGANTPPATGFTCVGEWPNGYILFAPQTNHFAALTLVTCGPGSRSPFTNGDVRSQGYCKFLDPGLTGPDATVPSTGKVLIDGNVVRDSNSDGINVFDDLGVLGDFKITNNLIKDLSQRLPDPADPTVGITDHVLRSRGITIVTIENSVTNVRVDNYTGMNLSPKGNFAADGMVFLTSGGPQVRTDPGPTTNAKLTNIFISNPFLTGDTSNGDSIEIQHRGSTNGVHNIDVKSCHLQDPASTNIKLIESSNPDNGVYNVSLTDCILGNINTRGTEDTQIRYNGTERVATKAINLSLKNVEMSGLGRGIGLTVPAIATSAAVTNTNNVLQLHIMVENSSLSNLTREAIYWNQAMGAILGSSSVPAVIDLGGGPLGSNGRNSFVNDGDPAFVPPGANPTAADPIDPIAPIRGKLFVAQPNATPPAIQIFGEHDFWGGGAPVVSSTPPGSFATDVFIPAGSNVTFHGSTFLTTNPHP